MTLSEQVYLCVAGETFDSIALAVYGSEKYAAELLCANPAQCGITVFHGGELLDLPVVELVQQEQTDNSFMPTTAPWKE